MRYVLLALTLLIAGRAAATGEINVLTDLKSPFPPGCVAVALPQAPASNDNTLWDVSVRAPSVDSFDKDARVQVTIWRTGCHDEGFSVVMVRLRKISGGAVLVPQVFAEAGESDFPFHQAQLIRHPAVGDVGATGNVINEDGITYMLAVEPFSIDDETTFTPTDYNDIFTLELFWGALAAEGVALDGELFTIPEYVPDLDPTQFDFPTLHGRMSGQYTIDGIPNTGLVLQIGEHFDDTNSVTALFFTYLNGAPFWIIGTAGELTPGFDIVELEMLELSGGEFFTVPPGSFTGDDVSVGSIGTMTVEALDCHRVLVDYDFSQTGLGSGVVEAERLIRMAGYDCNPWE